MRYFFYGTLTDSELREALLGGVAVSPARLRGWKRTALPGVPWPGIMAAAGAHVDGVVTALLTQRQRRRLHRYEGRGYRCAQVAVCTAGRMVQAALFVPLRPPLTPVEWDPAAWRRIAKPAALRVVEKAASVGMAAGSG